MDLGLKDKVAIITGTGSQKGFGKAIAVTLAQEGCHIAGTDVNIEGAEQTADEVKALGCKALAFKTDVSDRAQVDAAVKKTMEGFGKIDILVNNAGLSVPWQDFVGSDLSGIRKAMEVNFFGGMNMVQAVAPHMIERKSGRIVNFSGGQGAPRDTAYAASKAAVEAWSSSISKELAPHGVFVNIFLPPPAETNLGIDHLPPNMWDNFKKMSPIGRMCQPVEVARMIAFMVSEANSCMVGQLIKIGF